MTWAPDFFNHEMLQIHEQPECGIRSAECGGVRTDHERRARSDAPYQDPRWPARQKHEQKVRIIESLLTSSPTLLDSLHQG